MSYNIDHIETLVLDASMRAKDLVEPYDSSGEGFCEVDFVQEHRQAAMKALTTKGPEALVPLKNFWWYGEGSGRAYKLLLNTVAPKALGRVEAIFTWEGGDSVSGLIIDNGAAIECDVRQTLVPKKPKKAL